MSGFGFGAAGGWVIALAAAGVAALVTAIFFMKVRHPRVLVPSLLLWRRVLDEDRAVSFRERVRKAVSYAVAVLVPVLIVLAIGRPERRVAGAATGPLTLVMDSSLSMLAERPDGRTRWEAARDRALALASGDIEVTVLTTADGIVAGPTSDREALRVALAAAAPGAPGPFPVAPAGAGGEAADASQTLFLTDGVAAYDIPSAVRVESVFAPASNAAITAFDVRRDWRGQGRHEAYIEVANFSAGRRQLTIAIEAGRDRVAERSFAMNPDEIIRHVAPFDAGAGGLVRASITSAGGAPDALGADDEAFAWVAASRPAAVTLVSQGNPPLEALLAFDEGVTVKRVAPGTGLGVQDGSGTGLGMQDLSPILIFDRWTPERVPSQPALFIAPPAAGWLAPAGPAEQGAVWARADEAHPAVRGVDGRTLRFEQVNAYDLRGWTPLAFTARGTPLVAVREFNGARQAIFAFDVTGGGVANDPAFPVLVGDVLEWFGRVPPLRVESPGRVRLPGDVTALRRAGGGTVAMRHLGQAGIADLRDPGVYLAERPAGPLAIAVNAGGRASSNTRHSSRAYETAGTLPAGGTGLWMWLAAFALILLAVEFYTWHRRITV